MNGTKIEGNERNHSTPVRRSCSRCTRLPTHDDKNRRSPGIIQVPHLFYFSLVPYPNNLSIFSSFSRIASKSDIISDLVRPFADTCRASRFAVLTSVLTMSRIDATPVISRFPSLLFSIFPNFISLQINFIIPANPVSSDINSNLSIQPWNFSQIPKDWPLIKERFYIIILFDAIREYNG